MSTIDQKKPNTSTHQMEEKDKPGESPVKGENSPDVEEASKEGMQEAEYGERSYASPDFDKDDN